MAQNECIQLSLFMYYNGYWNEILWSLQNQVSTVNYCIYFDIVITIQSQNFVTAWGCDKKKEENKVKPEEHEMLVSP